ncbi:MAG: MarP family serine protease [Actinobacteria bacterium]|nr:MarP family serine protease [Actinomycetota bacterium]
MSVIDVLLALSIVSAIVGGYRLGFLARFTSWAGLVLGIVVGVFFVDEVAEYFEEAEQGVALLAIVAFLLAAGMLGQGLGLALGAALHASIRVGPQFRQYDRVAGSVLGVVGIVILAWLITPILSIVQGWVSAAARDSIVLRAIAEVMPDPPDTLNTIKRLIGDVGPDVFSGLQPSTAAGPPPVESGITPEVHRTVVASTVKVAGQACRKIQEGSGFVVGPDLVVTNAHVVAGEGETTVERADGHTLTATVVAFDPDRDLAVLSVPDVGRPPLAVASAEEGSLGAVYGHPGGGPLRAAPARVQDRVTALGRDIYDSHRTRRDVFILASSLAPGDSGGALVNQAGAVTGVAFAIAPDRDDTAYALTDKELAPMLDAVSSSPVDTGPCLV